MRVAALSHIKYGQSFIQRGDTTGAQLSFQQVSSVYPTGNFAGLGDFLTGTAFYIQGRFVEAIEHYQQVLRLYPMSEALIPSYSMMLFSFLQMGRYEEGASIGTSFYKLLVGREKGDLWVARGKLYLAELYYYLDRYPKAVDYYDELSELHDGINLLPKSVKEEQKFFQFSWHSYAILPLLFIVDFLVNITHIRESHFINNSKINICYTV